MEWLRTVKGAMLFEFNFKSISYQLCDLDDDSSTSMCLSFHDKLHELNELIQSNCKSGCYIVSTQSSSLTILLCLCCNQLPISININSLI